MDDLVFKKNVYSDNEQCPVQITLIPMKAQDGLEEKKLAGCMNSTSAFRCAQKAK
jgi:hypothetical protein